MRKVSAAQVAKNFGRYQDMAHVEPIAVYKYGRESVVILSAREYARLSDPAPRKNAQKQPRIQTGAKAGAAPKPAKDRTGGPGASGEDEWEDLINAVLEE